MNRLAVTTISPRLSSVRHVESYMLCNQQSNIFLSAKGRGVHVDGWRKSSARQMECEGHNP